MANDTSGFTVNDPRIKRRIKGKENDELTEKLALIRRISGYVQKIADLYGQDGRAIALVRTRITGYPDRSYQLQQLQEIYQRVQTFYSEQKTLSDKRKVSVVVCSDVGLLEEALESPLRRSQSDVFGRSSRAKSLEDYELEPSRYNR